MEFYFGNIHCSASLQRPINVVLLAQLHVAKGSQVAQFNKLINLPGAKSYKLLLVVFSWATSVLVALWIGYNVGSMSGAKLSENVMLSYDVGLLKILDRSEFASAKTVLRGKISTVLEEATPRELDRLNFLLLHRFDFARSRSEAVFFIQSTPPSEPKGEPKGPDHSESVNPQ